MNYFQSSAVTDNAVMNTLVPTQPCTCCRCVWRAENPVSRIAGSGVNAVVILINIAELPSVGDCAVLHTHLQSLKVLVLRVFARIGYVAGLSDFCQSSK